MSTSRRVSPPTKLNTYARKLESETFSANKFIPHVYNRRFTGHGCGASALALLTGVRPDKIPSRDDWTSRFMLKFLHERGFTLAKITPQNLTNTTRLVTYAINSSHVILASILLSRTDATWVVIYSKSLYHNFEIVEFSGYEIVNHPIITAYLVHHPAWK